MSIISKRLVEQSEREFKLLKLGFRNLLTEACEKVNQCKTANEIEDAIDEIYYYLDALKDSERKLNYYKEQANEKNV